MYNLFKLILFSLLKKKVQKKLSLSIKLFLKFIQFKLLKYKIWNNNKVKIKITNINLKLMFILEKSSLDAILET